MHVNSMLLLLVAATMVALVTRHLRIPYTVGLVLAGLGLGAAHPNYGIHLTKELVYSTFLPGLLFEAAYHLEFSEFRKSLRAILALAVPVVVGAIGATASLLVATSNITRFATDFGWSAALVFSALIAATDPIAVVVLLGAWGRRNVWGC